MFISIKQKFYIFKQTTNSMNLINFQKEIKKLNLNIFTNIDAAKIMQKKQEIVNTTLNRWEKQNKIIRIKKNNYSLNEINNKFELSKTYKDTYVALNSALEYYKTTTQRYNNLDLITKKQKNDQKINETKINFHKVKKELFFGFQKINNTFISDIEKTLIDCIYFSNKVYLTEINEFVKQKEININTLKKYLEKINSSTLNKRIGYLLELNNIKIELKINNKYEKLNKNLKSNNKKNIKWKLIINEDIENG